MISYIYTERVNDIAGELILAAEKLSQEFTALFKRLEEVPSVTKEWTGNQADFYFSEVVLDKQQYMLFVDTLRRIGEGLKAEATNAEAGIKTINVQGER